MNDFYIDDRYQREKRDAILIPYFYERWFGGHYQLCDGKPDLQSRAIDTIIFRDKEQTTIEEKIVREKHDAITLETKSCTVEGYEKTGWMFYGEADRLLWCFPLGIEGLDCWWIDFPALQKWFWPREKTFPPFKMKTKNQTEGRVVKLAAIKNAGLHILNFQVEKPQ